VTGTGHGPAAGPLRVLVICTGNSARSILGEAFLRHLGEGRIEASSAGTHPKGVNPLTLRTLHEAGIPTDGLASKPLAQFLGEPFDYVITVCDDAREACPVFPGARQTIHWGLPDPAAATGAEDERMIAFRATLARFEAHARAFPPIASRLAVARSSAPAPPLEAG
jgi:protein-tyrosine-phosphatase